MSASSQLPDGNGAALSLGEDNELIDTSTYAKPYSKVLPGTRYKRVFLSPPHLGEDEWRFVREAFETNWIAPIGPNVDAFEAEFAKRFDMSHAVAVASGTAAIHLAMRILGVGTGDEVFCSSLTFIASANPIVYRGARPVFIDSEATSWSMDPARLEEALAARARIGRLPKAVIVVDLYGQCANYGEIVPICESYGVPIVEDAAEALGSTCLGQPAGSFGRMAIFSFNGNKIITTSGGGMLVSSDGEITKQGRYLATQAREPTSHYEHYDIGYNYRMSNVLAGIGLGQLMMLERRIEARQRIFELYRAGLAGLPGVGFMPEAPWGRSTRWLTCITIDPAVAPTDREKVRLALQEESIESRPVWKPMHMQPVFRRMDVDMFGGAVSERLYDQGLCLPSGSALTDEELERIIGLIRREFGA
ncbi:MAG: DegT/DnrJ/EryC1/StrS family aminotransferase [Opitutaceae bacterium]